MSDKYAIDYHKLHFHPERVVQVLDAQNNWIKAKEVYPLYVEISPAGQCNQRCTFCAVDYIGYKRNYLDLDILNSRIEELSTLGIKSIMYAGEGEPMLHPKINEIVKKTKESGIDVAFTTNGTLMNKEFVEQSLQYCSWIKVSFNAGTEQGYSKIHRVKEKEFSKVIDNLKYAIEYKKLHDIKCTIGVQSILLPENANEIESLVKLARDLDLDYCVIKPYSQHKSSNTHEYENTDYSNYLSLEESLSKYNTDTFKVIVRTNTMKKYQETAHAYDKCYSTPFLWAYIMATGDVYGCSAYLLNDKFNYGNINNQTFKDIWTGMKRRLNYEFIQNGLDISDCRKNCRMDNCNRHLDMIINKKVEHINFI